MLIASLLADANNIHCKQTITSKKRLIETISHHLAANTQVIKADAIFQALFERERLGSTGLGKGVAIPHARIPGITNTIGTMMTLATPIKYESVDNQDVDIIFGLLVPKDSSEYHLQHLARLAALFSDEKVCQKIRQTDDAEKLFNFLLAIDDD